MYFEYTQEELACLKSKDSKLGEFIEKTGFIKRETVPDVFMALVQSVVGQQISNKAFLTVYSRLQVLCRQGVTAENLLQLDIEAIRSCGMSEKKALNIQAIAAFFQEKELDNAFFTDKSDEEIIALLTQLHGVGVWTVEMLLLFSLQRKNIMSYGDYGIKKGLCALHDLEKIGKKDFLHYKELYSPHGSIASLYLWEIAGTFKIDGK